MQDCNQYISINSICFLNNLQLTVSQSEQTEHKDGGNCEDFHVDFAWDCSTKTEVELMLRSLNLCAYIAGYRHSIGALQPLVACTGKFLCSLRLSLAG